jgi:hypothetical protein
MTTHALTPRQLRRLTRLARLLGLDAAMPRVLPAVVGKQWSIGDDGVVTVGVRWEMVECKCPF